MSDYTGYARVRMPALLLDKTFRLRLVPVPSAYEIQRAKCPPTITPNGRIAVTRTPLIAIRDTAVASSASRPCRQPTPAPAW